MKTQTKTEVRNSTAKAQKLLRGIDNEMLSIKKEQAKLDQRAKNVATSVGEVSKILQGISNAALATPSEAQAAPAKKPAKSVAKKPVQAKKPSAPAKKPAPAKKDVKATKPVQVKKAAAKSATKKSTSAKKPVAKPAPAADRPALKQVATDILKSAGKPMTASDIYKEAFKRHGYWSRQSLYNVLEKDVFIKTGEGAKATFTLSGVVPAVSDDEAEDFVKEVEKNETVASVS